MLKREYSLKLKVYQILANESSIESLNKVILIPFVSDSYLPTVGQIISLGAT